MRDFHVRRYVDLDPDLLRDPQDDLLRIVPDDDMDEFGPDLSQDYEPEHDWRSPFYDPYRDPYLPGGA